MALLEENPRSLELYNSFFNELAEHKSSIQPGLYESIMAILTYYDKDYTVSYFDLLEICRDLVCTSRTNTIMKRFIPAISLCTSALKKSRHYFIFTSRGRTATYWLAHSLNMHPEIICSHGLYLPPVTDFKEMIPLGQDLRAWTKKKYNFSVDEYFYEMTRCGNAKVYGNVHGYTLDGLLTHAYKRKIRNNYTIFNIIRHPVSRIESFCKRWLFESSYNLILKNQSRKNFLENAYKKELVKKVNRHFYVDFSIPAHWFFINALFVISLEIKEIGRKESILHFTHIPMEEFTSDTQVFIKLFSTITGGKLDLPNDYVDQVFNNAKINSIGKNLLTPAEIYNRWEEWKQYIFTYVASSLNFIQVYGQFGYNFSFVRESVIESIGES
ncbi:MAG: hypothetical protein ACMUJM_06420 [bacterium]